MTSGGIKMGMTPPHPGTFIRIEALEELGLSVAAAARILGVRRATLSDLVNGNASLSPEMALRVEKAFGLSMDLLLRMQAWHDATQMRARRRDRRAALSAGMIGAVAWILLVMPQVGVGELAPRVSVRSRRGGAGGPGGLSREVRRWGRC